MFAPLVVTLWLGTWPVGGHGCTPLQQATLFGDLEGVRRLAGRGLLGLRPPVADLDQRSGSPVSTECSNRTALMLAAEYGKLEIAELLISSQADLRHSAVLEQFGEHEFDARCLAVANGHAAIAATLETAGATALPCLEDAQLFVAIRDRDLDRVRFQLRAQRGAAVLLTALRRAVSPTPDVPARVEIIDVLAEYAVNSGVGLKSIWAAAIDAHDLQMVESLGKRARLTGSEELARAISNGQRQMLRPLITAGARTDLGPGQSAVLTAIRRQDAAVLSALLELGWRGDDETPVLLTAMRSYPELVDTLLSAGVGVEVDDEDGITPLMVAAEKGNQPLIEKLLARGASTQTADVRCRNAFEFSHDDARARLSVQPGADGVRFPGRAASRLHVGCGAALFRLTFEPDFDVTFDGALVSLKAGIIYRTDPGLHTLRIGRRTERAVKRRTVELQPGMTELKPTE